MAPPLFTPSLCPLVLVVRYILHSLRDALSRSASRVIDLLRAWDSDGNGHIERSEFNRAVAAMEFDFVASSDEIDALFDSFDVDSSGVVDFRELNRLLRAGNDVTLKAALRDGAQGPIRTRPTQLHPLRSSAAVAPRHPSPPPPGYAPAQYGYDWAPSSSPRRVLSPRRDSAESHGSERWGQVVRGPPPAWRAQSHSSFDGPAHEHWRRAGVEQAHLRAESHAEQEQLRRRLCEHAGRLTSLFRRWDVASSGKVTRSEFRNVVVALTSLMGHEASAEAVDAVFASCVTDGSGSIDVYELEVALSSQPRRGGSAGASSPRLCHGACSHVQPRASSPGRSGGYMGGGGASTSGGSRTACPAPPYSGNHASGNYGAKRPWVRQANIQSSTFASASPRFRSGFRKTASAGTPGPGAYGYF